MLNIAGIAPFSSKDFPGHLSLVVFCQGCPWRCRYCHNPHLQRQSGSSIYGFESLLELLRRRRGLLDGVVFSGGEPTFQDSLEEAVSKVRSLGFKIGLHTAGAYPDRLKRVLKLIDWVGLDIKTLEPKYPKITGIEGSGERAFKSLHLLVEREFDFEVRTTVHSHLLNDNELLDLASSLSTTGVRNFAVQQFRPTGCSDSELSAAANIIPSQQTVSQLSGMFPNFLFRRS